MGRTAKYKKIKACDPFNKQNGGKLDLDSVGIWGLSDNGAKPKKRSRTAEKLRQQKINKRLKRVKDPKSKMKIRNMIIANDVLNRPPSDDEDEFDLTDIQGSLKSHSCSETIPLETKATPTVKSTVHPNDAKPTVQDIVVKKEIKEATKLLANSAAAGSEFQGRRENESKRAYNRRVKEETIQIIKQTKMQELNPEKRKRKSEFLKQKKKRKRSSGLSENDDDNSYGQDVDYVPFGEQAERPPSFKALPRGASAESKKAQLKTKKSMDTESEQEATEKMRQRVQEQYALVKAKRKRAGDFHL